jgi:hypothetical protein
VQYIPLSPSVCQEDATFVALEHASVAIHSVIPAQILCMLEPKNKLRDSQ